MSKESRSDDLSSRRGNEASRLSRRRVLGLLPAAVASIPLLANHSSAEAAPPVGIEDIFLRGPDLARGSSHGVVVDVEGVRLSPGQATGQYVSPALTSQRSFTHIGVHWQGMAAEALQLEVRWGNAGPWSDWESLLLEAHEERPDETFASLVSADGGNRVQFRVTFSSAALRSTLTSATVTLLDASAGPEVQSLASTSALPLLTAGQVYSREAWGADDSLRFSGGSEKWPRMYVPVKKLVVHHTATSNSYSTVAGAIAEVRAVYTYHAVTLGWGDIGYNALIDKWGNVYEGRHGRGSGSSREILSPGVTAGHATSHNYGSTGIAMLGTYTKGGEGGRPGASLSTASRTSLVDLLAWEANRHDIGPEGLSDFLLYNDTWNRSLRNICGHRDCVPTVCPGGNVHDQLPSIRAAVAAKVERNSPVSQLAAIPVETISASQAGSLMFSWDSVPSGLRYAHLLEGWRRTAPGSEDIDYLSGFDAAAYPTWELTEERSATFGDLLDRFSSLAEPVAGHYTFHVVAVDASNNLSYQQDLSFLVTETASTNHPPTVTITSPGNGSMVTEGASITLSGSASDAEDGNLTPDLAWSSSLQGALGTGGSLTVSLAPGAHVITASVTDSVGLTASESVSVTVSSTSGSLVLSADGYKVQGLQRVDLSWTGSTSSVEVYRDGTKVAIVDGSTYTDLINRRGGGSYRYVVRSGTTASNEVLVTF